MGCVSGLWQLPFASVHGVTATCAWTAWQVPFSVNWTGILANSFVHVCMYFYYFLTDLKLINPLWGGRIITPIQLVQFFLCVGSSYYALAFGHIEECNFHMVVSYLYSKIINEAVSA
ncbi:hypothetical protein Pelo_4266 [Pelomyxa schiedti]|nr:hypothetical protein Pelo_4266 [Pelomyxa schiedti]